MLTVTETTITITITCPEAVQFMWTNRDNAALLKAREAATLALYRQGRDVMTVTETHLSDEELLDVLRNDASLQQSTRDKYYASLQRLFKGGPGEQPIIPGSSLLWCIMHPEQVLQQLAGRSPAGLRNFIAPVLSIMARHPAFKTADMTAVRHQWAQALQSKVNEPLNERARDSRPTDRQMQGYVHYQEVADKFWELYRLDRGGRDTLLVGLIGLAASSSNELLPQRADYGRVKLFVDTEPGPEDADEDQLVIYRDAQDNDTISGHITLQHYKTRKTYGTQTIPLPEPFIDALMHSLCQQPRRWLFTQQGMNKAKGIPYATKAAFGNNANARLKELFGGRPFTLTGARHSFISYLMNSPDYARLSHGERKDIAHRMSTSFAVASSYRWVPQALVPAGPAEEEAAAAVAEAGATAAGSGHV
jgi:hypothetical protein